jgi:hypothetical protein
MNLALRGEMGPATVWLGRAQRLVEREERECVEHVLTKLGLDRVQAVVLAYESGLVEPGEA